MRTTELMDEFLRVERVNPDYTSAVLSHLGERYRNQVPFNQVTTLLYGVLKSNVLAPDDLEDALALAYYNWRKEQNAVL